MVWNLGSVSEEVSKRVDNIPDGLSGAGMNNIIIGAINKAQNFVGNTIGSTAIAEQYQEPLVLLTMNKVQSSTETQGLDKKTYKLGELSITNQSGGKESNTSDWEMQAMDLLKEIKGRYTTYQAWL